MSFKNLDLPREILQALDEAGYVTPTPIQEQAIPEVLKGSDLRASAQTGTGKTAAFMVPSLARLVKPAKTKGIGPRILVLVPTRELAMQVAKETIKYSKFLPKTKTVCIFGGASYQLQNRDLSRPFEILVGTPGRIIDHMERGRLDLSRVEVVILDEADRMLDMGFIKPVEKICAATPKERQTLLFSATLKGAVLALSKRLLTDPVEISVSMQMTNQESIEQHLYPVDNLAHKYNLLEHLLQDSKLEQAIIFTATKRHADELVDVLHERGIDSSALHGGMHQNKRTKTIKRLRSGEIRVLVATDVAARGLDVLTISHVINFDLPMSSEDYVHRIGRTGRAGETGVAHSFAGRNDFRTVKDIEKFTGQKMNLAAIPGMEAKFDFTVPPKAGERERPKKSFGKPYGNRNNDKKKGFFSRRRTQKTR